MHEKAYKGLDRVSKVGGGINAALSAGKFFWKCPTLLRSALFIGVHVPSVVRIRPLHITMLCDPSLNLTTVVSSNETNYFINLP
jgi:hypothetical protein